MSAIAPDHTSWARRWASWIGLAVLAGFMAYSLATRLAEEKRARQAERDLAECCHNLTQIGAAIDSYSPDSVSGSDAGHPPATLKQLLPQHLQSIPTCPVAGRDTYSAGYACADDPAGSTRRPRKGAGGLNNLSPRNYTIICTGSHPDADLEPGFPQYTARDGLRTFPVTVRP